MVGVNWPLVAIVAAGAFVLVIGVAFIMRIFARLRQQGSRSQSSNLAASASVEDEEFERASLGEASNKAAGAQLTSAIPNEVPELGNEIVLKLKCGPLGASHGFTREVKLVGANGRYTWTLGSKDSDRYEHWDMRINADTRFTVTGEYIEGVPDLKPVSFTGTVVGSVISGEGVRGPRKSTIHN